jgi:hypothetical protein
MLSTACRSGVSFLSGSGTVSVRSVGEQDAAAEQVGIGASVHLAWRSAPPASSHEAWACLSTQALAAIWDQRLADAVRRAEDGLLYVPAGMGAARLDATHARAPAAGGDAVAARAAMTTAEKARGCGCGSRRAA